jgi:hypothetical protein
MDPKLYQQLRSEIEYYYDKKIRSSDSILLKCSWYLKKGYALLKISEHQKSYDKLSWVYLKR